jgi:deazaflavin-dependent oxidoreductase (nitroreductase family)
MSIHTERAVPSAAAAARQAAAPTGEVRQVAADGGAGATSAGRIEPVGPARVVRVVRPLRNLLNPLVVKRAGRRGFAMAARLEHVGRRSGRTYVTPVTTRRDGDLVLIALTFGNQSDWCQNVLAAGGCTIQIDGVDYAATAPALLGWQEAAQSVRAAFRRTERAMLRVLGIRQFLRLDVRRISAVPAGTA